MDLTLFWRRPLGGKMKLPTRRQDEKQRQAAWPDV